MKIRTPKLICVEVNNMNRINCTAKECVYNSDCKCEAEEIAVHNCNCKEAHCCEQTECAPFRKKEL